MSESLLREGQFRVNTYNGHDAVRQESLERDRHYFICVRAFYDNAERGPGQVRQAVFRL